MQDAGGDAEPALRLLKCEVEKAVQIHSHAPNIHCLDSSQRFPLCLSEQAGVVGKAANLLRARTTPNIIEGTCIPVPLLSLQRNLEVSRRPRKGATEAEAGALGFKTCTLPGVGTTCCALERWLRPRKKDKPLEYPVTVVTAKKILLKFEEVSSWGRQLCPLPKPVCDAGPAVGVSGQIRPWEVVYSGSDRNFLSQFMA
ncbi:hypothetical protein ACRRTK_010255 [Alexandromys fortis]